MATAGDDKPKTGKIAELFVYDNFNRVPAERVEAGDIVAFTGLGDVGIGETVCTRDRPAALPTIEVSFRVLSGFIQCTRCRANDVDILHQHQLVISSCV